MDVTEWLKGLGFERYTEPFAENDIDGEILRALTDEDLKELGVASLGHRKKILTAIAALETSSEAPPHQPSAAERRQVTVLFADLAGYTALSNALDSEDIHRMLGRFFETVDSIIEQHGGSIDKHIGDCVMGVFGAPVAHSNDAERAVRAAIEIQRAVESIDHDFAKPIGVHIGIASGQVVASGIGSSSHHEYTVTGDSVNLASRLTEEAGQGATLISEAVYQSLADRVECAESRMLNVKGLSEPIRAWQLLGMKTRRDDREFVGRRGELQQLRGAIRSCLETGYGQAIYVRGAAGIGKTRLIEELQDAAGQTGFQCHTGLILDFGTGSGQDAIRSLVRSLLGLVPNSDEAEVEAAAEQAVDSGLVELDRRVYLNDLLGLRQPAELRALFEAMDNSARNEGKRDTVAEMIETISARQPLLLVVEDLHWADRLTLDYLVTLTERVARCPVVLTLTSRVEGDPLDSAWRARIGDSPLLTIDLGPLHDVEARALAEAYEGASKNFTEQCLKRAAGNPLFLEQLLRHANARADEVVPDSVQSIVQARLDQLNLPDRAALQAAAVLGQRFSPDALRFLLGLPDYSCEALVAHFLIRPLGREFLFGHALIRDGIYGSLLRDRRRSLHKKAAEWFAGRDLALTAEHLERAEDPRAAAAYLQAAEQQYRDYHYERAIALVRRGQDLASDVPVQFALIRLEGDLLRETGSTPESIAAFERAADLAEGDHQLCRAWIGLVAGMRVVDRIDEAYSWLDKAEELARAGGLDAELSEIHYYRGSLHFPRGKIDACLEQHNLSLEYATRAGLPERQALALSGLGDAYYAQGRMRTAFAVFRRCLDLCHEHGLGRVAAANHFMLGTVRIYLNELEEALEDSLRSADVAARVGHQRAEIVARLTASWILTSMLDLDSARHQVDIGLNLTRALGAKRFEPFLNESLARIELAQGNADEAARILEGALKATRDGGALTFIGPWILGSLARASRKSAQKKEALKEGERLLDQGCVGHNYYRFYQNAIEACLSMADWDGVERYASRLAEYTAPEPVPWSEFYISRGRVLAQFGRGDRDRGIIERLRAIREEAEKAKLRSAIPAIDSALAAFRAMVLN